MLVSVPIGPRENDGNTGDGCALDGLCDGPCEGAGLSRSQTPTAWQIGGPQTGELMKPITATTSVTSSAAFGADPDTADQGAQPRMLSGRVDRVIFGLLADVVFSALEKLVVWPVVGVGVGIEGGFLVLPGRGVRQLVRRWP